MLESLLQAWHCYSNDPFALVRDHYVIVQDLAVRSCSDRSKANVQYVCLLIIIDVQLVQLGNG